MQPMGSISCQSCGAPSPLPPSQTLFTCPYCKVSYPVNAPPPPMAPPNAFQQMGYGPPPGEPQMHYFAAVPPKPRRSSVIGIVIALVLLPLVIAGFVASIFFVRTQSGWSGTETLECGGNDEVTVSDINATIPGDTAISASGNCVVHVKRCSLKGSIGIEAYDNAHAIVEQGSVDGTESAIDARDNARVELHGTKVSGPKKRNANAKIVGP